MSSDQPSARRGSDIRRCDRRVDHRSGDQVPRVYADPPVRADAHVYADRGARRACFLASLLIAVVLCACERPFEEETLPRPIVLSPDLSVIQHDKQVQLAVRVQGNVGIEHVLAGSDTLVYDEDDNAWRGEHVLTDGLNRIVIAVVDAEIRTTQDTVYALQDFQTSSQSGPHLPVPRGGHTTTRLPDGSVYVIGGASELGGSAEASALVWRSGTTAFAFVDEQPDAPRVGHTATLLPDGRILLLGGGTNEDAAAGSLIEAAEAFDPQSESFTVLQVEGAPIRRMYHTASLHEDDDALYIDLYGGLGSVGSSEPVVLSDVRRFRVESDRLVALDPSPGPRLDERLYGHSQIELFPNVLGNTWFILTGALFDGSDERNVSFELEYRPGVGLLQYPVGELTEPRMRHAATLLEDGFVGIFGGWDGAEGTAINEVEIYSAVARGYFIYPESTTMVPRFGHTATKVENERILLVGGFLSSGEGVVVTERYRIPHFQPGLSGTEGR